MPDIQIHNDRDIISVSYTHLDVYKRQAQEPWLTRYVMYRVMPPAKGMETMGFFNYRVHENLGLDVGGRRSLRGLLGIDVYKRQFQSTDVIKGSGA